VVKLHGCRDSVRIAALEEDVRIGCLELATKALDQEQGPVWEVAYTDWASADVEVEDAQEDLARLTSSGKEVMVDQW